MTATSLAATTQAAIRTFELTKQPFPITIVYADATSHLTSKTRHLLYLEITPENPIAMIGLLRTLRKKYAWYETQIFIEGKKIRIVPFPLSRKAIPKTSKAAKFARLLVLLFNLQMTKETLRAFPTWAELFNFHRYRPSALTFPEKFYEYWPLKESTSTNIEHLATQKLVHAPIPTKKNCRKVYREAPKNRCAFCNPTIIKKQLVISLPGCLVLCNYKPWSTEWHFLLIPIEHREDFLSAGSQHFRMLFDIIDVLSTAIVSLGVPKINISAILQNGVHAGQTQRHSHMHVLARPPHIQTFLTQAVEQTFHILTEEEMTTKSKYIATSLVQTLFLKRGQIPRPLATIIKVSPSQVTERNELTLTL